MRIKRPPIPHKSKRFQKDNRTKKKKEKKREGERNKNEGTESCTARNSIPMYESHKKTQNNERSKQALNKDTIHELEAKSCTDQHKSRQALVKTDKIKPDRSS